jgi:hypothetical protein
MRSTLGVTLLLLAPAASVANDPAPGLPADRAIEQAVDHHLDAAIKKARARPAPSADDATLLRRLTLDLAGRVPTLAEAAAYLADTDPLKKTRLVDRLLAAPAYARHQANEFTALLQVEQPGRKGPKKTALRDYLQGAFAENRSWDLIFRELLLPDGAGAKPGADEFLKGRVKDHNKLTIDVSTMFFGVNVSCAQCHDHPHVPAWTQDHFYGMKSFFARTIDNGGTLAERDFGSVKYLPNKGQEKVAPVMFLTGKSLDVPGLKEPTKEEKQREQERINVAKKTKKAAAPPTFSLRARFVETALEPANRDFFARNAVNRTVYRLFGRGLVMPLDQMHTANPASHPELMAWLARDLATHGYDLRRLVRGLALSSAYARASRYEGDAPVEKLLAVALLRPLTPAQMALSLKVATLDPESLPRDAAELEKRLLTIEKAAERLAALFPQPGERFQVGVAEAMLFANNEGLQKELLEGPGTLPARMLQLPELEQRADLAVRTVLSRAPRPEELSALTNYLRQRQDRPAAAAQQIVWALLTSAEFRFNH